jgi:hypothetical protein
MPLNPLEIQQSQKDRIREDGPRIPFMRVGPHIRYDLEVVKAAAKAQEIGEVPA